MQVLTRATNTRLLPPSVRPSLALYGDERWYLVHTQPRRELGAQVQLKNQAFRTFLPKYRKTIRHARKVHRTIAPLFPRYMFVILDLDRDPWHSVNGSFGVTSLVMTNDRPVPAAQGVVEALILSSAEDGEVEFREDLSPGQPVRIAAGPFSDQIGILKHLDDRDRVCVLLQMMGGAVPVRMPRADILPLN